MKFDNDLKATLTGITLAGLTASQPVIAAVDGSFKQSDWLKLAVAVFLAVQGWLSNRTPKAA